MDFETELSNANADAGSCAFVTSNTVKAKWKGIPKIAASTVPIFLWEKLSTPDGTTDGEVNGYRAATSNLITDNTVCFGNWEELIMAQWGGFDLVVDPFTNATTATVNVVINAFVDMVLRHAVSMLWSTDTGNQ